MQLRDFDFNLPEEAIAKFPVSPRDSSRLLYVSDKSISHQHFIDLPSLLDSGDLIIMNDTKVIPARLFGLRGDVKIEVMIIKLLQDGLVQVLARPAKRCKIGDTITFAIGFEAKVTHKDDDGTLFLDFAVSHGTSLLDELYRYGSLPLPPYLNREAIDEDQEYYQTTYAREPGSVAAPTAGLHFTDRVFSLLKDRGVNLGTLTLHVGAGTFLPVKTESIQDHRMHAEWFTLPSETVDLIHSTKQAGRKVIAVGTTTLRCLESVAKKYGQIQPCAEETDIFITPGFPFKVVDRLLTNFHLPKSTLFMLVCAFAGFDEMHRAYNIAINEAYRFFSYGDACLLDRREYA